MLDRFDVDAVRLTESLYNDISQWLSDNHQCRIYALHQQQIPHNFAPGYDGPDIDTGPLQGALDACRVIKSPHEISLIRRAVHLSSFAHCSILHNITSMKSEAEIHGLFTDICISHGAKRQAYTPIVASGSNAAILHYTKNEEMLKGKGQVCLDAGCEWDCYSSDITRTFPTSKEGWTTKETAEIYAIVEDMQERCIEQLKPGVVYMDLYVLAHRIAIEGLLRLGVFQAGSDFDTIMKKGYSRVFFPHGLGHHIGLEVHDVSQQPLLRLHWEGSKQGVWHDNDGKRVPICSEGYPELWPGSDDEDFFRANLLEASLLQENMVLTVEPGICESVVQPYSWLSQIMKLIFTDFSRPLINDLILHTDFTAFVDMEILARYMHVGGVRIEDDILITAEGFENLTTAPKGAEMLDIIREGAKCQHGVDCPYRANSPV